MEYLKNSNKWFNVPMYCVCNIGGPRSMQCADDFITYFSGTISHILEVATPAGIKLTWISLFLFYWCNFSAYVILGCFINSSFIK